MWTEWAGLAPDLLAAGENLLSLRLVDACTAAHVIAVENVELHVAF
jgi:hypothetical protein